MEAQCRLFMLKRETLADGSSFARLHSLELQRDISPQFAVYPWTVIHIIDDKSPLHNLTPEEFVKFDVLIQVLFSGNISITILP
jgi:inward rectifier potassium channel